MEQLQPTSILSLFETDKSQRASFVNQVIESLNMGSVDPLKLHLQVKCTEQLLSELKERPEYKESVLSEASKYGNKFEHYNADWQIKEAGVKYDYSKCGDSELKKWYADMEELKEKIKKREKMLQNLGGDFVDANTGEILSPPVNTSTTTVQVTLK